MVHGRIKYYGSYDLGNYIHWDDRLKDIEQSGILRCPIKMNLNDIIELYNIGVGYQNLKSEYKSQDDIKYPWLSKVSHLAKQYFNSLPVCKIVEEYKTLEREYVYDFWTLFENCKIFDKDCFTVEDFKELCNDPVHKMSTLQAVLRRPKIVKVYDKELFDILDNYPLAYHILFHQYEQGMRKYHLPKGFKEANWDKSIAVYLNEEDLNPNMLELIMSADFPVSPMTKVKAKKRYDLIMDKFRNDSDDGKIKFSLEVIFTSEQSEIYKITQNKLNLTHSYNSNYLKEELSDESILGHFVYPFGFLDGCDRITIISHLHELSGLDQALQTDAVTHYKRGQMFDIRDKTSLLQLVAYCKFLKDQGHSIEEVIQRFYNLSLATDYNVEGFKIDLAVKESSYLIQSENMVHCIEGIINQYRCYVLLGKVDWDYVEAAEDPADYRHVPSKINNKYFYADGKYCIGLSDWLFSDQILLGYIESKALDEKNLYDMIQLHNVHLEDYPDYQQDTIRLLIKEGILYVKDTGYLKWKNPYEVRILKDLYDNDFGETAFLNGQRYQSALKQLSDKHMIRYGSTLLSESEGEYFNFYLNTISSSNGPHLRNLYSHGKASGLSEEKHRQNYFLLLRLLVLLTLKIKDELIALTDWGL